MFIDNRNFLCGTETLFIRPFLNAKNTPTERFVRDLNNIPERITAIDFAWVLNDRSTDDLIAILAATSQSRINTLQLLHNNLAARSMEELVAICKAVPLNLTTLNISYNGLADKSDKELAEIYAAIPSSVTSIICDDVSSDRQAKLVGEKDKLTSVAGLTSPRK